MAKFAVLGSSYVERLRRFTSEDLKVPGEVRWFGVPGLRCDSLTEEMWRRILTYKPDCLFLHVGGNDITTTTSPNDVVRKIMDIYCNLKDSGVKSVFWQKFWQEVILADLPTRIWPRSYSIRKEKRSTPSWRVNLVINSCRSETLSIHGISMAI